MASMFNSVYSRKGVQTKLLYGTSQMPDFWKVAKSTEEILLLYELPSLMFTAFQNDNTKIRKS